MSDLVCRQDAIDALGERPIVWMQSEYETGLQNQYDSDLEAIQNVPSAQRWTPCSEGLPKTDNWRTTFNVTTETGSATSMEWENTIVRGKLVSRWVWQGRISPWEVFAWMPLPAPWEGAEDESL